MHRTLQSLEVIRGLCDVLHKMKERYKKYKDYENKSLVQENIGSIMKLSSNHVSPFLPFVTIHY